MSEVTPEQIEYAKNWANRLQQRSGADSPKSSRERKAYKYKAKVLLNTLAALDAANTETPNSASRWRLVRRW